MTFPIGIQISPHVLLAEGIDRALDLMQETGGINTLMLNTHTYYGACNGWRKPEALAPDHGVELADPGDGSLERPWIRHDASLFEGCAVSHRPIGPDDPHGGRDLFLDVCQAAHRRGMKVHARYLEGWETARLRHIPNWSAVLAETVYGQPGRIPCFANPDFIHWWRATVEDVARQAPIDGYFLGFERRATLSDVLFGGHAPYCFCDHCKARARDHGVDIERARQGLTALHELAQRASRNDASIDGYHIELIRLLTRYPEILAWDRLEDEGQKALAKLSAETVRAHRPDAAFGMIALPHGIDWFRTARESHAELAQLCDYIVLRLYLGISGPRLARDIRATRKGFLQNIPEELILSAYWHEHGLDHHSAPTLDQLATEGLPLEFVEPVTRHTVQAAGDSAVVYSGPGIDIPGLDGLPMTQTPDILGASLRAAWEAGARGFVLCREYEEIRASSLRTIGQTLASLCE